MMYLNCYHSRPSLSGNVLVGIDERILRLQRLTFIDLFANVNMYPPYPQVLDRMRQLKRLRWVRLVKARAILWKSQGCRRSMARPLEELTYAHTSTCVATLKNLSSLAPSLKRLDLEGNNFRFIDGIGAYTKLEYLNVNYNALPVLPTEIGALTRLRELHLRDNRLVAIPAILAQLTSLTHLDVSRNPLLRRNEIVETDPFDQVNRGPTTAAMTVPYYTFEMYLKGN